MHVLHCTHATSLAALWTSSPFYLEPDVFRFCVTRIAELWLAQGYTIFFREHVRRDVALHLREKFPKIQPDKQHQPNHFTPRFRSVQGWGCGRRGGGCGSNSRACWRPGRLKVKGQPRAKSRRRSVTACRFMITPQPSAVSPATKEGRRSLENCRRS